MSSQRVVGCASVRFRSTILSLSSHSACHNQLYHSNAEYSVVKCTSKQIPSSPLFRKSTVNADRVHSTCYSTIAKEKEDILPPLPPLTPSSIPFTVLLDNSTMKSLASLPEIQKVFEILKGSLPPDANSKSTLEANQIIKEAQSNLQRARDIFQTLPDLYSATFLLEAALYSHIGQFNVAMKCILLYRNLLSKNARISKKQQQKQNTYLQLLEAKLFHHSGKFTDALSEYENLLDNMQLEVERQLKRQKQKSQDDDVIPVIDGAAVLTGVGLNKLLLYDRCNSMSTSEATELNGKNSISKLEIVEAIETATSMLVESRLDAIRSPKHFALAVDLGLAASMSLTNLGVVYYIIDVDEKHAVEYWEQALNLLDTILRDSVNSATIISRDKFLCMESLRARLLCNIASAYLQLVRLSHSEPEMSKVAREIKLKESSEIAGKALKIYDELLNGPKTTIVDKYMSDEECESLEDDNRQIYEWEQLMSEADKTEETFQENTNESAIKFPGDCPISPLWKEYHRAESARALGLVASCYVEAGASVTAEGLFLSAVDASSSYPIGQCLQHDGGEMIIRGVPLSSPNLALIACDIRKKYASLCDTWEKRKSDADRLRLSASKIEKKGVLKDFASDKSLPEIISSLWLFSPLDFMR